MKEWVVSFRVKHSLFYLFFCLSSVTLLTFCGDSNNNSVQDNHNAGTAPADTPTPTPTPTHRFTPSEITAGLPFSFEMVWLGKPYLLSLNNCGTDTLLLQGTWPDSQSAITHIEGQDGKKLTNLAIVDTSGSPTIPTGCQLKATVDQGKTNETSTLMPLTIKAGTITLSNANMLAKNIELEANGVPSNEFSIVVVGKKETSTPNGVSLTEYRFVALSMPLTKSVQDGKLASNVELYVPPPHSPPIPTQKISGFETGDYLISVVIYRARGFDPNSVEFLHISAIKASKD